MSHPIGGLVLVGHCEGIGNRFPGSGGLSLLISDAARTVTWTLSIHGFNVVLNPRATITLPDGLTPVPLPAALPLFAAGLGIVTFLARRKKTTAVRPA